MSADSSESVTPFFFPHLHATQPTHLTTDFRGHARDTSPSPPEPAKSDKPSSSRPFSPDWSSASSNYMAVSPSDGSEDSAGGLNPSDSSPVASTVHSPASERPSRKSSASLLASLSSVEDDEENVPELPVPRAPNRPVKRFGAVGDDGEEEEQRGGGDSEVMVRNLKGGIKARVVSYPAGAV